MTPAGLPDTIDGLRRLLAGAELSVDEAIDRQQRAFAADTSHCTVSLLGGAPAADRSLPLAGVGLAHKDIYTLPGRVPECGAGRPWPDSPPVAATVIRRLQTAGSTPLAALAMAEHACGATGENPRYPLPINPIDPAAAVGGSSSGSAVAVARGLCYGSLGTDTAGSVRIPAATCGVLGLKPTRDLLPRDGVAPLAPSLDTVGIMARTATDALALLRAVNPAAGPIGSAPAPRSWRIATCWNHPDPAVQADTAILDALDGYAGECTARGQRREHRLGRLPEWTRLAQTLLYAEAATSHAAALRGKAAALSPLPRTLALAGAALPAAWHAQAMRLRAGHTDAFLADVLEDCDVLLTPALPRGLPDWTEVITTSPHFAPRRLLDLFCWLSFVNYLGLPAIVFPVAQGADGRPVSVQAIARPGAEDLLLALARQAEHSRFGASGYTGMRPAFPSGG
ncbi:amidase [Bordetella sp. BOR01]|uniref:amidase n=1 Tax=Bordetella sp. BOR01 TaxID=2854779 RepID=UPI001C45F41D|nr:amidase [Bordetella sp. BOR01]MBV7485935.1 amidase [Bordetella sp. BOR01]